MYGMWSGAEPRRGPVAHFPGSCRQKSFKPARILFQENLRVEFVMEPLQDARQTITLCVARSHDQRTVVQTTQEPSGRDKRVIKIS